MICPDFLRIPFYVAQVGAEILALNGINTERGRVGDAKVDGNRNETQELQRWFHVYKGRIYLVSGRIWTTFALTTWTR